MRNITKNFGQNNGIVGQLVAEKKKVVIAVCLVSLMAFMWIKVLTKKSPQGAGASVITDVMAGLGESKDLEFKISMVELPVVKGRNDVLTRDFFSADSGGLDSFGKVNIISGGRDEEVVKKIAQRIKLEAILANENPQAFINDTLLSVGDTLSIKEGDEKYECEVISIEKSTVVVKCLEAEIVLKLAHAIEVEN